MRPPSPHIMTRRGHEIKIHLLRYVFTTRLLARFHYVFWGFSRSRWDFSGQNEFLPTQHRLVWATRGLASHTELPKSLRTIPTYIVYDNVTQCLGHKLLSVAMRFSEKTNDRLHWLRTEGPGTFRLQGNVSGHCRLMGVQSLTCLEYFPRRLIRSVRPDRVRFVSRLKVSFCALMTSF